MLKTIRLSFFQILFLFSPLAAQETELKLPEVTTFLNSSVEQKIVLTADDIEAGHFESLSQVLEKCGIQNLSYGPYGLESKPSIRGFTDETVRVVIDGICVNNAQYGTFDFSSIDLTAIEKIEIVRGAFTEGVEDEGAVGGVIYITQKKQTLKNTLEAEAAIKTYFNKNKPIDTYFQKLAFAGKLGENTFLNTSGNINFAANQYRFKLTPSRELAQGAFAAANQKSYWQTCENALVTDAGANACLTHYFGDGNYFSFGDIFYGGHKHTPGPVNSTNPGLQRDYNNNLSFTLWNPALAELFNMKNCLVWLCNNRFYKDKSESEDSSHYINTVKYTGTADFTCLAGGHLRQLFGFSADFSHLKSTNDGKHIQFSGVVKETSKINAGAGWTLSLPLAAKFCVNDNNMNFAFLPKLGAAWESGIVRLTADLYRMVQFPNMDDLFWEGGGFHGNPNLKPESGWGAELGFNLSEIKAGRGLLHGNLNIFSDYYKDKIQWASGTTQNLSSAFYLGVDFGFGGELFEKFFTFDINGEYLYNRLLDKSNQLTYGKRIMWTPDFVCTIAMGLNFELVKLKLTCSYSGRRYTSNLNAYYLKPYLLLDFSAEGSEIAGHFTPYLKLENLLNWQYQAVDGYSMPGISLKLGGRVSFL